MNQDQRKVLQTILDKLTDMQATVNDLRSEVDTERDAEDEKYANLSDGLQASEKGQALEEARDNLDGVISALDEAESALGNAIDNLNDTINQ